ncbi:MAG: sulfatase [Pirellulales bacterium]
MKNLLQCIFVLLCGVEIALASNPTPDVTVPDPQEHWRGSKPNILWIMLEDWSTDLSCYGTPLVQTPNIDRLATEGIRYEHAFSTAPVCSTSRSAMMTGFHQNYIHAHQHRTANKQPLPYGIRPIPHLLKEAGYFTGTMRGGKTDCNFTTKQSLFDGNSWNERSDGQPFFIQATFAGTHRGFVRDPIRPINEKDVVLPPYYPDVPLARRDWANGLETVQVVDRQVGELLDQLEADGLKNSTIVFLIADHGRCHIRGKQFLYDPGVHVPLIVRYPDHIRPKSVSSDLVSTLDICQTIVVLADARPQHPLHGKYLFGKEIPARKYVHFNRDKMDDTHDAMRAVRSKQYKLIHNLMPERAYCQLNEYKERSYPMLALMNVLAMQGQLNEAQSSFMKEQKAELELYDLEKDPHEINNVANDPSYADIKATLLHEIHQWRKNMNDQGITDAFRSGGWPSTYPTRSIKEWTVLLEEWNTLLLIDGKASHTKRKKKKK